MTFLRLLSVTFHFVNNLYQRWKESQYLVSVEQKKKQLHLNTEFSLPSIRKRIDGQLLDLVIDKSDNQSRIQFQLNERNENKFGISIRTVRAS